eukprot:jgi/Bigna1/91747/estExt_fgenesh1_pg.C_1160039
MDHASKADRDAARTLYDDIQTVLKDGGVPESSKERWAVIDTTNVKRYTKYKSLYNPGFELDSFQKRAVRRVMGCAPTATGKTMIAIYAVANALRLKKRLIWTNPIKALSNQAFSNLRKRFEEEEEDTTYHPTTNAALKNNIIDQEQGNGGGEGSSTNNGASSSSSFLIRETEQGFNDTDLSYFDYKNEKMVKQLKYRLKQQLRKRRQIQERHEDDNNGDDDDDGQIDDNDNDHGDDDKQLLSSSSSSSSAPKIGILTGDVKKHADAPVVVMTTEILHSMCLNSSSSNKLDDVAYVVFDEAHYINDVDRGWVYEQLVEMLPSHISLIFLSATLKNDIELANWVGRTRGQKVYVCRVKERPIPLAYSVYTGSRVHRNLGNLMRKADKSIRKSQGVRRPSPNDIVYREVALNPSSPTASSAPAVGAGAAPENCYDDEDDFIVQVYDSKSKKVSMGNINALLAHFDFENYKKIAVAAAALSTDNQSENEIKLKTIRMINILNEQGGKLPAIMFILSRARILEYAKFLLQDQELDLIPHKEDKNKVFIEFQTALCRIPTTSTSSTATTALDEHKEQEKEDQAKQRRNSGDDDDDGTTVQRFSTQRRTDDEYSMIKEIYERLMQHRPPLIKVLLATETVACGVDTPTKTVVFTDVTKHDGTERRLLHGTEVLQMAGRAGRRGYDKIGHVLFPAFSTPKLHDVMNVIQKPSEPIKSRFKLRDQLVLSLLMQKESSTTPTTSMTASAASLTIEDLLRRSLCEGPKAHMWDLITRIKEHINSTNPIDGLLAKAVEYRERIKDINQKISSQLWQQIRPKLKVNDRLWYLPDLEQQEDSHNAIEKDDDNAFVEKQRGEEESAAFTTSHHSIGKLRTPVIQGRQRKKPNRTALEAATTTYVSAEKILLPREAVIAAIPGMQQKCGRIWVKVKDVASRTKNDNDRSSSSISKDREKNGDGDDDVVSSSSLSPSSNVAAAALLPQEYQSRYIHHDRIVRILNGAGCEVKSNKLKLEVLVLIQERKVLTDMLMDLKSKFQNAATMTTKMARTIDLMRCEDSYFLSTILDELRYRLSDQALYLMPLYEERLMTLMRLGFVTEDKKVSEIGVCAAQIIACDSVVLLTWLNSDLYPRDPLCFAAVASALVYPGWKKRMLNIEIKGDEKWERNEIKSSLKALLQISHDIRGGDEEYVPNPRMIPAVYMWASGENFGDAATLSPDFEGNFVQVLQRLSEVVRQLLDCMPLLSSRFPDLTVVLEQVQEKIRRGIVVYESIYLS